MNITVVLAEDLVKEDISFESVIGLQNLKNKAAFIVKAAASPSSKVDVPKGLIFAGLPGCGKTYFGKILAKYLGYNYVYISAASLQSPVPGIGKSKVIKLFKEARNLRPCLLFIDEVDAVIKDRDAVGDADSGGILQQFLTELDGTSDNKGMLVIAATNVLEKLDSAFVRSGRFDMKFNFTNPNKQERALLLYKYLGGKHQGIDLGVIAEITEGMSYADLGALYKIANEQSFMDNTPAVTTKALINATKIIQSGESSNQNSISAPSKRLFISHMAGHVTAYGLLGSDFMTFGQISAGTKLICHPGHRKVVIHRCSDYIIQLSSIICVRNLEIKNSSATNLYFNHDHCRIEKLLDNIIDMTSNKVVVDDSLRVRLKEAIVHIISEYMNKLLDKYKDLFLEIEQKLFNSEYITRKELVDIANNNGVKNNISKNHRADLEFQIKNEMNSILKDHAKARNIDIEVLLKDLVEVEEEELTEEIVIKETTKA